MSFLSCNKNSNELPPIVVPDILPNIIIKTCKYYGTPLVRVIVTDSLINKEHKISAKFINASDTDLTDLTIVLEIGKDSEINFDNCVFLQNFQYDKLAKGDTITEKNITLSEKATLRNSNVNAGVIRYNGRKMPISKLYTYNSPYSANWAIFETDSTHAGTQGLVKGYVLADGNAVFRFKRYIKKDTAVYNTATGCFFISPTIPTYVHNYNGNLDKSSYLSIDTLLVNNIKVLVDTFSCCEIHMRFNLNPQIDSTKAIYLNLSK